MLRRVDQAELLSSATAGAVVAADQVYVIPAGCNGLVRERRIEGRYPYADLMEAQRSELVAGLGTAFFALVVAAGFFGVQDAYSNIIPTFIWVIWWVGFAFVCALVGNMWELVNPFDTLFRWAERAGGGKLSLDVPYPAGLEIRLSRVQSLAACGAWHGALLIIIAGVTAAGLLLTWSLMALAYLPVISLWKRMLRRQAGTGLVFRSISTALLGGAWWMIAALGLYGVGATLRMRAEERLLSERFGADTGRIARIILVTTAAAFLTFSGAVALLREDSAEGLRKLYQDPADLRAERFVRMQAVLARIEREVPGARRAQDSAGCSHCISCGTACRCAELAIQADPHCHAVRDRRSRLDGALARAEGERRGSDRRRGTRLPRPAPRLRAPAHRRRGEGPGGRGLPQAQGQRREAARDRDGAARSAAHGGPSRPD